MPRLNDALARARALFPSFIVFFLGILATIVITDQLRATTRAKDEVRFNASVQRVQDEITKRLATYEGMLYSAAGLLAAEPDLNASAFRAFVERLQLATRFPGIQGIGFSRRLTRAELPQFVARQRGAGLSNFLVWPEGVREEYHTILYLEPLDDRNRAAIGFDMFTEPIRQAAMARARDTGRPAASGAVTLVQEIDEQRQPGFLLYLPVYRGGVTPETVAERRRRLLGFVYSPFRAADLFKGIFGREAPRVGFELYDRARNAAHLLYRSAGLEARPQFTTRRELEIAGRTWSMLVASSAVLDEASSRNLVPIVAVTGVVVTFALAVLLALQSRERLRVQRSESALTETSARFRLLADSIPQLVWMARPDGRVYWFNQRWYQYTGTTPDQIDEFDWQSVHDPAELSRVRPQWQARIAAGEPFEMEFPLRAADGTYRWFLTRVIPVRDTTGQIIQWFGTNTDVQSRRDAEQSLKEYTERLEILNRTGPRLAGELELEPLVQAVTDAGTQLTRAQFGAFFYNVINANGEPYALYTLSGVPREEFERFPMPRNTAALFSGEAVLRSDDITADPRYSTDALCFHLAEGHLPVRSYLAVPVVSRSGEVLGGLFFGHEQPAVFTQQVEDVIVGVAAQASIAIDNARLYKQVQALLERERGLRTEAERVSSLKDEFLATLSHELRTPLNAIIGWTQLLIDGNHAPDGRERALTTIQRNARAQARLVEDLLDMSRIISGKVRLDLKPVELPDIVDAALNVVRPTAQAKGVHLVTSIDPGVPAVLGDANRLQQIAWNLLTNAIKFTPCGGRVEISLERHEGRAHLVISDTGTGIDPEFLPFVFDRFRQADGSTTRQHGGLGLGLSIVKSLTEMHGGHVTADSTGTDHGATFTISLPEFVTQPLPRETALPGTTSASTLEGTRVLLVEDDLDALELTSEILKTHSADVTGVRSVREALRTLHARPEDFDIVVSDLAMPEVDGYQLVAELRSGKHEALRSIPAIALSAYARREDQARATEAGYQAHVSKPFDPVRLVHACLAVLQQRNQRA